MAQRTPERQHEPLPRGLHNLSRDEVVASQRERLLIAATEVAAEKGYAATSVADILKRARVSRLTFYEMFSNKEACFIAAYDLVTTEVSRRIGTQIGNTDDPFDRAERALTAYLDALAGQPELARFFIIESFAVGPALITRRIATQNAMGRVIAANFGATSRRQVMVCEGLIGAIIALVTSRLLTSPGESLSGLKQNVVDLARPVLSTLPDLAD